MSGTAYEPTDRTRVRRRAGRGSYDRELIHSILDEAMTCHVGFVAGGQPYVIPTIHARVDEVVYLHGAPANRTLRTLAGGAACCLTATLIDGVVLARSAAKHSLNYRSAVVLGSAREVVDPVEKTIALRAVVEHVAPGRWDEVRPPSHAELRGTTVLALPIVEASAKVREGPPVDLPEDADLPVWAGVLPADPLERNKAAVRDEFAASRERFPGLEISVEDQVAEGDRVATRWVASLPEAGATIAGITIERFEDGRVVESWRSMDMLGLLRQLRPG